jgi:hypothetical protein
MQHFFFSLCFFISTLALTHAGTSNRVFLTKSFSLENQTGSYELNCRFFSNKVEITEETVTSEGPSSSIRFEATSYSGAFLKLLIWQAAMKPLKTTPFNICDGGSAHVEAFKSNSESFDLVEFEDCGPSLKFRDDLASLKLRSIVEEYCPTSMPSI